jgi:hypothetical protein
MTSLLIDNSESREVPKGTVNAQLITIAGFKKLVREMLEGGGVTSFLFGSSRSGKTTFLTEYIIPLFAEKTTVIAFLPNHVAQIYDGVKESHECIILPEMRPDIIRDVVQFQRDQMSIENYKKLHKAERPKWTFVLDDVTGDIFKTSPDVSRLYTTHRNLGISSVICAQYVMMAKKESRANVNLSIYFKLNTPEARISVVRDHLPDLFISNTGKKFSVEQKADAYAALTQDYIIISDNLNGQYYILSRN